MNRTVTIAATVIMIAFMAFCATLILANHAQDLRGFLILCGQAGGFAIQFWLVHRAANTTKNAVEHVESSVQAVADTTDRVETKVQKVQATVDGNTPPGIPVVKRP